MVGFAERGVDAGVAAGAVVDESPGGFVLAPKLKGEGDEEAPAPNDGTAALGANGFGAAEPFVGFVSVSALEEAAVSKGLGGAPNNGVVTGAGAGAAVVVVGIGKDSFGPGAEGVVAEVLDEGNAANGFGVVVDPAVDGVVEGVVPKPAPAPPNKEGNGLALDAAASLLSTFLSDAPPNNGGAAGLTPFVVLEGKGLNGLGAAEAVAGAADAEAEAPLLFPSPILASLNLFIASASACCFCHLVLGALLPAPAPTLIPKEVVDEPNEERARTGPRPAARANGLTAPFRGLSAGEVFPEVGASQNDEEDRAILARALEGVEDAVVALAGDAAGSSCHAKAPEAFAAAYSSAVYHFSTITSIISTWS